MQWHIIVCAKHKSPVISGVARRKRKQKFLAIGGNSNE
jgi:hypothetical protein